MLRNIMWRALKVARTVFMLIGILVTCLVIRQTYLDSKPPPKEVRAQLRINLDKIDAHFGGPKK